MFTWSVNYVAVCGLQPLLWITRFLKWPFMVNSFIEPATFSRSMLFYTTVTIAVWSKYDWKPKKASASLIWYSPQLRKCFSISTSEWKITFLKEQHKNISISELASKARLAAIIFINSTDSSKIHSIIQKDKNTSSRVASGLPNYSNIGIIL